MTEPKTHVQQLAEEAAHDLGGRVGVDAAFVFLMRRGDDTMGCGIRTADDLPYDCIIGGIVQLLGELRRRLYEKITTKGAAP